MSFNKLRVSEKATKCFPFLKARTSLTPNILSRMALCLSLSDASVPDSKLDNEKGQEFSRYTLLGEWDTFFISLLRERLIHDGLDPEKDIMPQFKAHLNRGVIMLSTRIKDLGDVYDLIPSSAGSLEEKQQEQVGLQRQQKHSMQSSLNRDESKRIGSQLAKE